MTIYAYSPNTGEIIHTETVAPWMGTTTVPPPEYDRATQGCFWRGSAWEVVDPVHEVPVQQEVTRFQARAALYNAGLLDSVENYIALSDTPMLVKLAWADAQSFVRTSDMIVSVAAGLGLTDAQVDALFVSAAVIE